MEGQFWLALHWMKYYGRLDGLTWLNSVCVSFVFLEGIQTEWSRLI